MAGQFPYYAILGGVTKLENGLRGKLRDLCLFSNLDFRTFQSKKYTETKHQLADNLLEYCISNLDPRQVKSFLCKLISLESSKSSKVRPEVKILIRKGSSLHLMKFCIDVIYAPYNVLAGVQICGNVAGKKCYFLTVQFWFIQVFCKLVDFRAAEIVFLRYRGPPVT